MTDINNAVISGKLVKIWEPRETDKGTVLRGAVLEVERFNGYKARFDVKAFGDPAEVLGSFSEDDRVVLQYELDQNSYKKDDEWINKVVLNVRSIHALASAPVAAAASSAPDDDSYPF